jgi:hypothetical protein
VNAAKVALEKKMKSERTNVDKTFRRMMIQYHPNKTRGNDHNSKMLSAARNALKKNKVQRDTTVMALTSPNLSEAQKLVSTSVPWLKRGRWTRRIGRAENNPVELRKILSNLREGISLSKTISSSTLKNSKTKSKLAEQAIEADADRAKIRKQFENAQKAESKPVNEFYNANNTPFANRKAKEAKAAEAIRKAKENANRKAKEAKAAEAIRKAKENANRRKAAAAKAAANLKAKAKAKARAKNEERARQQARKAKQLEEARKRELASRKRSTKKMKAKNRMKIKKRR